ncbi:MAG: phosphoribosylformylglycinamidine synthase I [candidate division WOR-3 bacterium]|jgi:phosphoribosylformylglycinamidine synthase|nr:phosphoribosylformylglycinamidine synthase I [candidate division WOR-3 bacterium]MCR4423463.1 phosphoribosylformylglycinamidine synthase I [candidate division WOR-3 bacterium]MDH7518802.1 phosphoribosylformylglycinamidine synthase I [bacterium]
MVKVCVLFAAGINCDQETAYAFELAGADTETVHINRLKEKPHLLDRYQVFVIPGGFSYGDYIASGRVLANELKHHLAEEVCRFLEKGKLILGICNGFQVLVKSGLLPGFEKPFEPQTVTLDTNDSARYEDRWVYLKTEHSPCVFTSNLPEIVYLPVAHAEGKFIPGSHQVLKQLKGNNQIVFRYVTVGGQEAKYPDNPNGSVEGIAGICDPTGRIFGLMPHPERYIRIEHHPRWHRESLTKPDGIAIFENAVQYVKKNL